jgi:hypothetical protein
MSKLKLSDWASIAEIVGMIGVIISLLFVAASLERNTLTVSGQTADQIYESMRNIDLVVLQDPELLALTKRGHDDWESLSQAQRDRYAQWVGMYLEIYEQIVSRQREGLVLPETMVGWQEYYSDFAKRHINEGVWAEISWWWPVAPESGVHALVNNAIQKVSAQGQ